MTRRTQNPPQPAPPGGALGSQAGLACRLCHSPVEVEDLRCAVCALPTPNLAVGDQVQAVVLRCDECGAAMDYKVEVQAPKCAFCGSIAHLEESEDPLEEAQSYLPFVVSPDQARDALRGWLGNLGWFRPDDLQSQAVLTSLRPLWWVGWAFSVDALVSWTADSNLGNWKAPWAPHSGQSQVSVSNVLVSASRGLTHEETGQLTPHYREAGAAQAPHPIEGAVVERFDVQRSRARGIIERAIDAYVRSHVSEIVPGSRYRNLKVAVLPQRLVTRRLAFPAYVLAYRYKNKAYRAIVHGQSLSCVFGKAPYSALKIGLALAGVAVLLLTLLTCMGIVSALR